jgi:hypothetical protein
MSAPERVTTSSPYQHTVTGPLGPPLEGFVYPHVTLEARRAGPFAAHVAQRAREEEWTVTQTRAYVATLRALAAAGRLTDPRPPSTCRTCRHPLPLAWDARREAHVYCSAACRQKAYRHRHARPA